MNDSVQWLSTRTKRVLAGLSIPVAVVGIAAAAQADVPKVWTAGEVLSAEALNLDFSALDERLTALESAAPTVIEATSETTESSTAVYTDVVYQALSIDLTPGTWRVDALATLTTTVSPDAVQIGLWNDTTGEEIAASRSPMASTVSFEAGGAGSYCPNGCSAVSVSTSKVITVTAPTKVRIKAFRNGNSRVWVGINDPNGVILLKRAHRMVATKMH